jgi:hypothetical protein
MGIERHHSLSAMPVRLEDPTKPLRVHSHILIPKCQSPPGEVATGLAKVGDIAMIMAVCQHSVYGNQCHCQTRDPSRGTAVQACSVQQ